MRTNHVARLAIVGVACIGLALNGCRESKAPTESAPTETPSPATPTEPAPAQEIETPPGTLHVVVPAGTVLRSGPDPASEAVDLLQDGGLFPVRERDGDAYRIEFEEPIGESRQGWIHSASGFKEVHMKRSRVGPQEAPEPDQGRLAEARQFLDDGGREQPCGPYRLFTDISGAAIDGTGLTETCQRLVSGLDAAYFDRFGVRPVGPPRGAIVLFRELKSFRAYAVAGERGAGGAAGGGGHAGHAQASRGLLVLYVGEKSSLELVQTLVHELTHLVNRRALGAPLPRWLSEGLADALGDPATPAGLGPSIGLGGAEHARRRVLERPELPDVRALTARDFAEFDAGPQARDYEQSAVLVRFLLSGEHADAFRAYLAGVAAGESAELDRLLHHMRWRSEDGAERLDRELRVWLTRGSS